MSPSPGDRMAFMCWLCQTPSAGHVAGSVDLDGVVEDPTVVTLVQCEFCQLPYVLLQDDAEAFRPKVVWPLSNTMLSQAGVPKAVQHSLQQARMSFAAGAYDASAVMVRRSIEAFCAAHGVRERSLARSLQVLADRQLIDSRLLEWTKDLKLLGNVGAHAGDQTVSEEDARDSLDLAEALFQYTYIFAEKYNKFRARRHPDMLTEPDSQSSVRTTTSASKFSAH